MLTKFKEELFQKLQKTETTVYFLIAAKTKTELKYIAKQYGRKWSWDYTAKPRKAKRFNTRESAECWTEANYAGECEIVMLETVFTVKRL